MCRFLRFRLVRGPGAIDRFDCQDRIPRIDLRVRSTFGSQGGPGAVKCDPVRSRKEIGGRG
jgi:hypothetical protein